MQTVLTKMSMPEKPAGGDEKTGGGGGGQRQGMLAVNDLNYVLAPDLSVSVNNTFKNHYFQSNVYTNNQRGICILNSGSDYGDMRSSTLNFMVRITTPTPAIAAGVNASFGKNGSILNIIRALTISSRSGDEISRVQDLNHLSNIMNPFRYSENWMNTVGQAAGFGGYLDGNQTDKASLDVPFSIPLYLLSDFFNYSRLTPAMVLAGLRIEIEWEDPGIAFQAVNAVADAAVIANQVITGYTITNPYVSMRSVQLTDGTQRALNEMSAVNGLEIVYCDYERTETLLALTATSSNVEVRKAASRALKAFMSVRKIPTTAGLADSFRSEPWDYVQWQWQLGSLYFPQQPVKSYNSVVANGIPESYQHTLVAFNTYKGDQPRCSACPMRNKVKHLEQNTFELIANTYADAQLPKGKNYTAVGTSSWAEPANGRIGLAASVVGRDGTFANGRSTICCLLERSDLFNLTGVPINNARVLNAQATFGTGTARSVTIFLKYVRLARVFLNNVEVEQ